MAGRLPTDLNDVFRFCELLWYSNGTYQQALNRVASYFVTRVKISGVDSFEHDRWADHLENDFGINRFMVNTGRNLLAYGNVLLSPRVKINRFLRCPCGRFAPYAQWQARFSNHQLRTDIRGCPQCRRSSVLQRQDFRSLDPGAVSIRLWNPHTIKVKYNSITDRLVYRHILPRVDADAIRRGDNDFLEDTPWEFVEAALQRKPLKIATDRIFHLRDIPLAGVDSRGMGVPRGMANFRQAFLSQIMQRLNMVLGMEYSTPFRSITPEPMSVGMDRFADLFTSISSGTCH